MFKTLPNGKNNHATMSEISKLAPHLYSMIISDRAVKSIMWTFQRKQKAALNFDGMTRGVTSP